MSFNPQNSANPLIIKLLQKTPVFGIFTAKGKLFHAKAISEALTVKNQDNILTLFKHINRYNNSFETLIELN